MQTKRAKHAVDILLGIGLLLLMSYQVVGEAGHEWMGIAMTAVMHWFTACLLGGLPLSSVPGGFLEMIGPVWISCFIVSLITQRPAIRAAKRICGR